MKNIDIKDVIENDIPFDKFLGLKAECVGNTQSKVFAASDPDLIVAEGRAVYNVCKHA